MANHRIPQALLLISLLALPSLAQTDLPNLSTATLPGLSSQSSASSGSSPTNSGSTPSSTGSSSTGSSSAASTTGSNSASTTSASSLTVTSAPSLTSSNGASFFSITGSGPTVAGAGIPTMIVPDTSRAPFMQKSSLPEGTVFICVGAILGFLGACVLAWRGLVAWALHRSVRRAARHADAQDAKAMLRPPGAGFYSSLPGGSMLSLEPLGFGAGRRSISGEKGGAGSAGEGGRGGGGGSSGAGADRVGRPSQSHTPRSSLFFSPTAGAGLSSAGAANRNSQYLPAGYYAAGAAQAAGGNGSTHLGQHGASRLSRTSLGALTGGTGPSPPDSPSLPPSRGTLSAAAAAHRHSRRLSNPYSSPSGSALDLNNNSNAALAPGSSGQQQGSSSGQRRGRGGEEGLGARPSSGAWTAGRAPSAYLEDLFENHGNGPRERF
ncbi:MAG: hypothetical protein M1821_001015 [Bathelium mastoideum]|nr:MAG: hypothetical protein M1821_001015 [Bathelium mastoideum]KAI9693959.1 MAG: hypothetical protein M1822_003230 [Bathelium mastoideum]